MADTNTPEPLYYTKHLSPSEQKIVARLVDVILATGYTISVYDGEAFPVKRSDERDTILNNLGATEEEQLNVRSKATKEMIGTILLVYGNEPGVVIADYTDNATMRALLAPVETYAETFAQ